MARTVSNRRAPRLLRLTPALKWLKRECVALLGVAGAALTVLTQVSGLVPMTPILRGVLARWHETIQSVWRPPLATLGADVHPHLLAAATLSVFLVIMAVGARIAALRPVRPGPYEFLGTMTTPSLIVFGALIIAFLFGNDSDPASSPLIINGSQEVGKFAFAFAACSGYFLGDLIASSAFHSRLIRLGMVVAAVLAADLVTRAAL